MTIGIILFTYNFAKQNSGDWRALTMYIIVKFENRERLVEITVFFIISDGKIMLNFKYAFLKDVYHH